VGGCHGFDGVSVGVGMPLGHFGMGGPAGCVGVFLASRQRLIFRGGREAAVQAHAPAAGVDDRSLFCKKQIMRCAV
jgi:hypothetical protein